MFRNLSEKVFTFIERQHIAFKVNIVRNIITNFSLGLVIQYQSIYMTQLGASVIELGLANSISGVISTVTALPVGWLADKYGIKKLLLTGIIIMILSLTTFGLSSTWQFATLALVLYTISFSITIVVCPMVCGKTLLNEERVTGMQLCDTVSGLPRLVAPIVAAYIITKYGGMTVVGIRPLYWIAALGYFVALLFIFRFFKNPYSSPVSDGNFLSGFTRVFKEGRSVKGWLLYQSLAIVPMYLGFYIPLYAREVRSANAYIVGMIDSAYWFSVVLLAIPVGVLADKFGRKKMISLMSPVYCLGLLLLVYAPNDLVLVLAGALSGFFFLVIVTESAISLELVPGELLGSWTALSSLGMGVMGIICPFIGGLVWERLGPNYLLFFMVLIYLVKLILLPLIPETVSWE